MIDINMASNNQHSLAAFATVLQQLLQLPIYSLHSSTVPPTTYPHFTTPYIFYIFRNTHSPHTLPPPRVRDVPPSVSVCRGPGFNWSNCPLWCHGQTEWSV